MAETADGHIVVSFRNISTVVMIERQTGNIIWRLGRPPLAQQHDPRPLPNGNILIFDNGTHRADNPATFSRVIEVDPRTNAIVWEYADQSIFDFFSPYISGAQRLANGNTLICEGCHGRIFEVTRGCEVVWEYVSPHFFREPGRAGLNNWVFRGFPLHAGRDRERGTPDPRPDRLRRVDFRGDRRIVKANRYRRIDRHAPGTGLPSSAPEFGRSRQRDRLLHPAVPEHGEGELGRLSGAQIAQQRAGAVHQGRQGAADRAAECDLAFRLARHRRAPQPRDLQGAAEVELLPLYTTEEGGSVLISSDTWPNVGGVLGLTRAQIAEAKAKGVRPAGGGGFAYMRGPDNALVEYAGNHPAERFNHVHLYQEDPIGAFHWYQKHLNAPVRPGYAPAAVSDGDGKVPARPDRTWPALNREGMFRTPRAGVEFGDVSMMWYANQGDEPLASSRGQLQDHIALSVEDLDAWVDKLRGEGVKFLEEPYPLGDTRAVMIEGPSREALELVEVR